MSLSVTPASLATLLLILLLAVAPAARAYPGGADPNFGGGDGIVLLDFAALAGANPQQISPVVAVDSLERVWLAAWISGSTASGLGLARLLRDGTPDPTFGDGGLALLPFATMSNVTALKFDNSGRALVAFQTGNGGTRVWRTCRLSENGALDPAYFGPNCATAGVPAGAVLNDLVPLPNGGAWMLGAATINDGMGARGAIALAQIDPVVGVVRSDVHSIGFAHLGATRGVTGGGDSVLLTSTYRPDAQAHSDIAMYFVSHDTPGFFYNGLGTFPYDRGDTNEDTPQCLQRLPNDRLIGAASVARVGGRFWGTFRLDGSFQLDPAYAPGFGGRTIDNITNVIDYGGNIGLVGCALSADGTLNLVGNVLYPDPDAAGANSSLPAVFRMRDGARDTGFGGPLAQPGTPYSPSLPQVGTAIHPYAPATPAGTTRLHVASAIAATRRDLVIAGHIVANDSRTTIAVMKLLADTLFADDFE
jgi:hypothetical protein